jgi:hypothetical protein
MRKTFKALVLGAILAVVLSVAPSLTASEEPVPSTKDPVVEVVPVPVPVPVPGPPGQPGQPGEPGKDAEPTPGPLYVIDPVFVLVGIGMLAVVIVTIVALSSKKD